MSTPSVVRLVAIAFVVSVSVLACEEGRQVARMPPDAGGDAPGAAGGGAGHQATGDAGVGGMATTGGTGGHAGAGGSTTGVGGAIVGGAGGPGGAGGAPTSVLTLGPTPPPSLGSVLPGARGAATPFTLTNGGNAATGGLTVTVSSIDFELDNQCGTASLAAHSSCTINITLVPKTSGAKTATLTVNAAQGGTASLNLTGTGLRLAQLTSTMTSSSLGSVEIGIASAPIIWTISNSGDGPTSALMFSNSTPTNIKVSSNSCTGTLAGNNTSCAITFTFTPTVAGSGSGTLSLSATTGGTVSFIVSATGLVRLTVAVTGTGTVSSLPAGISCGSTCSALFAPGQVTLQARPNNGSSFRFSAWGGATSAACSGVVHDCNVALDATTTVTATFVAVANNLVFASSAVFAPNLGSATAYDAKCNAAATAAGINTAAGNGYIAFTSSAVSLAKTRLGSARGWVRMDGKPYADTQATLFTNKQVWNAVVFDETGALTSDGRSSSYVMTGTNADGTLATGVTCNDWTTTVSSVLALGGSTTAGPAGYGAVQIGCNFINTRILCMGTTKTAAVSPIVTAGRKIWTSATLFTPGISTPDAVCQAERPSGVTTASAMVAYTNRAGSAVLDPTTSYARPDGTLVGTGAQIVSASLLGGVLQSGLWQRADGTYDPTFFSCWTGSTDLSSLGTVASTCNNWTDVSTQTATISSPADLVQWWGGGPNNFCNNILHLICVQISP